MTVCIAAMNPKLDVIVTVSDMLLSDETSSMDTVDSKMDRLIPVGSDPWSRWVCLYSGDPTVLKELTDHVKAALESPPELGWSRAQVMTAVQNAYDAVIHRRIEREVLAQQYGMNFAQFSALGQQKRGGGRFFDAINERIAEAKRFIVEDMLYHNPTELLVCGFGEDKRPNIFSADPIGRCTLRNGYGFHAIGIGAPAANAWLLVDSDFQHASSVSEMIHRMCEAKFLAESPFVGKDTVVNAFFEYNAMLPLFLFESTTGAQLIRDSWEQHVKQKAPSASLAEIDRQLNAWANASDQQVKLTAQPDGDDEAERIVLGP
jgi:hypothetical protein